MSQLGLEWGLWEYPDFGLMEAGYSFIPFYFCWSERTEENWAPEPTVKTQGILLLHCIMRIHTDSIDPEVLAFLRLCDTIHSVTYWFQIEISKLQCDQNNWSEEIQWGKKLLYFILFMFQPCRQIFAMSKFPDQYLVSPPVYRSHRYTLVIKPKMSISILISRYLTMSE